VLVNERRDGRTRITLDWLCKGQTVQSLSSAESETIALSTVLRKLLLLLLLVHSGGRRVPVEKKSCWNHRLWP
jgi:hypothetical protein